jgi:hypothetical protein
MNCSFILLLYILLFVLFASEKSGDEVAPPSVWSRSMRSRMITVQESPYSPLFFNGGERNKASLDGSYPGSGSHENFSLRILISYPSTPLTYPIEKKGSLCYFKTKYRRTKFREED